MKKRCAACGETKPIKQFSKHKGRQDGYQRQCKACCKVYQKIYQQSDSGKEAHKRYDQSEKGRKTARRFWQSDKGKKSQSRYEQSEKGKQSQGRYKQSGKGKQVRKKSSSIRRTNETQVGGSHSATEWYNLCKFYDFCCLKCNKKLPFEKLTLDHVKPVSKGGSSHIRNLQPLCGKCNSKKGNKEIDYRKTLPDWINRDGPIYIQDSLF